jgi:hypothetical protein
VFGLDASMIDEDKVDIESIETLQFHKSAEELPSGAIRSWEELCSLLGE